MKNNKVYYLYILECSNGHIYTGQTLNFERRLLQHQQGHVSCKYTRSFPPKAVLLCAQLEGTVSQMLKLELAIKRLTKLKKLTLINNENILQELISSYEVMMLSSSVSSNSKLNLLPR